MDAIGDDVLACWRLI